MAPVVPEWLVSVEIHIPSGVPAEEVRRRFEVELARAQTFRANGSLLRIWRVPGRWANWALWSAADATALHAMLMTLPLYEWADVTVRPLAVHPVEAGDDGATT
jgi:muconolactone D-isomerase